MAMRRGLVAFCALALVGLGLTGCGLFRFEQREPWRVQAEEACLSQRLVQPSAYMALSSRIDGPGACGIDYPFKVSAFSNGAVGLTSRVTLACPIIPRIDQWLDEIVRPAAQLYFGTPLLDIKAGSYSCRPRNNQAGAKLSEHSFGNALDIMGFTLADGREVTIVKGWKGSQAEQEFLREVFVGACRYFTTVLGPGSNAFHYDHLHIDLARHDPRGYRRVCQPYIKFTPRIDPEKSQEALEALASSATLPAVDVEQELPEDGANPPPVATAPLPPMAPRSPAPGGYAADLPRGPQSVPVPPYGTQAPQAYVPPPPPRQAPGQPLVLNGHSIY